MNRQNTPFHRAGQASPALRLVVFVGMLMLALGCETSPNGAEEATKLAPSTHGVDPDLIHVRGQVSFDRSQSALDASLTYSLVPGKPEIGFLLNRGLSVEVSGPAVAEFEESRAAMNSDWKRIAVRFDSSSEAAPTTVQFRIAGSPILPASRINQISDDWIELGVDSAWHPVVETIDRLYTAELTLDIPSHWQVVSSGTSEVSGNQTILRNTIPQVDIAFMAAPGLERAESGYYALYHRAASDETIERLLRRANDCREVLDRRFGGQDPLPRGRFVMADRSESGYARKNYVVLTNTSNISDAGLTDFLCHELAHYWSSRGAAFTVDNWLNEGFATLVGVQAVREVVSEHDYEEMVTELRAHAQGLGSIWTPNDLSRRSYAIQYKKAPIALLRLEQHIGIETFESFVRSYMAGVRSTPELLTNLELLTDAQTRAWFEQVLSEDERNPD